MKGASPKVIQEQLGHTTTQMTKADDDCLTELRWIYDRRTLPEARADLASWRARWQAKYAKLCDWAEENIEATFAFFRLPQAHLRRADLPQCRQLSAPRARPRRRTARGVAGREPLPEHDLAEGTEEGSDARCGEVGSSVIHERSYLQKTRDLTPIGSRRLPRR